SGTTEEGEIDGEENDDQARWRQRLCRSRPAEPGAGPAQGTTLAANLQDREGARAYAGASGRRAWHQAAACLGADAKPRRQFLGRTADGVFDRARAGRADYGEA